MSCRHAVERPVLATGSALHASYEVEERHAEKEDALVRAICNVFDSESESEDSVGPSGPRPAAKKRRCSQVRRAPPLLLLRQWSMSLHKTVLAQIMFRE